MKIKMQLLSDVVFGNGASVPGSEDISVLNDVYGFPYFKGGTFKGIFREEMMRYLEWTEDDSAKNQETVTRLLGKGGDSDVKNQAKLVFSDFQLSDTVKNNVLAEIGDKNDMLILDSFTHLRTFTSIEENGIVKQGSLRSCRCVNKGVYFYSEVQCLPEDEALVKEVLSMIKWVGTMRNRGFGKVQITVCE